MLYAFELNTLEKGLVARAKFDMRIAISRVKSFVPKRQIEFSSNTSLARQTALTSIDFCLPKGDLSDQVNCKLRRAMKV